MLVVKVVFWAMAVVVFNVALNVVVDFGQISSETPVWTNPFLQLCRLVQLKLFGIQNAKDEAKEGNWSAIECPPILPQTPATIGISTFQTPSAILSTITQLDFGHSVGVVEENVVATYGDKHVGPYWCFDAMRRSYRNFGKLLWRVDRVD